MAKTSVSIVPSRVPPLPDETRPIGQEGQPAGRAAVHVADGDRRLARAAGVNQPVDGDLGAGGVADVVGGLPGDVAGRAVVELGGDDELLVEGARRQDPLGGKDPQRLDAGSGGPIIAGARGDPGEQGLGLDRVAREPQAPFVGDGPRRLEHDQARSGAIRLTRRPDWSWVSDW